MSDQEAVWAQTTDGGLLHQLFGYYPTLHDAVIRTITFGGDLWVSMIVDYRDSMEGGDAPTVNDDLAARIRLEWTGVREFSFPLGDENLLNLNLSRRGDLIETTLETWPDTFGTIVSETFEAVLMQVDPGPVDERARIRFEGA